MVSHCAVPVLLALIKRLWPVTERSFRSVGRKCNDANRVCRDYLGFVRDTIGIVETQRYPL